MPIRPQTIPRKSATRKLGADLRPDRIAPVKGAAISEADEEGCCEYGIWITAIRLRGISLLFQNAANSMLNDMTECGRRKGDVDGSTRPKP
jgi:hypothetical protein